MERTEIIDPGFAMVACIWRGVTLASQAEKYLEHLNHSVVPHYQAQPGNRGIYVLRDIQGELAHFLILSFWESMEGLVAFTGQDRNISDHLIEGKEFLIAYESIFSHYKVVSQG